MNPTRQWKITFILLLLLAVAYGVRRYISSREELRTFTQVMRFTVTNDVIYFRGEDRQFAETNSEWARGLRDVSGESAFVTINEVWKNGRRVRWRAEGVRKPALRR